MDVTGRKLRMWRLSDEECTERPGRIVQALFVNMQDVRDNIFGLEQRNVSPQ